MIHRLLSAFTFPMLSKELLEQAQQKRTYAFRFLYCLILYIVVLISVIPELLAISDPMDQFGRGGKVFDQVNSIQMIMIVIFMPIITSGTIAHEKERNTLQLLLLTRLSSWNIVFEKFLSRLLTMFSFLLMSLPLTAVAYALGGVSNTEVWVAFQQNLLLGFLFGAVSIACSSYCASSFSALLMSYLLSVPLLAVSGCCSPILLFGAPGIPVRAPSTLRLVIGFIFGIPFLLVGGVALLYARNVLFDRSTIQPTHPLLRLFRCLDEKFHEMNQNSLTRGIQVLRSTGSFPVDDPIAWRERTHTLAGSPTHLMRLFSLMMIPLSVILFIALSEPTMHSNTLGPIIVILWYVSLLVVLFSSTPLFIREKGRQTLDVLLSIPISTRDLLEQKRAGVVRLIELFQVVLWLVLTANVYMSFRDDSWYVDLLILLVVGLSHRVQLATVSWLGLMLGAWQKHLVRALALGIIGLALVWSEIPRFLLGTFLYPVLNIYYMNFVGAPFPMRDLEWLLPNLETIFRPLWIDDFWNPRYTIRDDIAHFPWSLLIGFVYQVVLWRLVRRMAYTRSRTDLPRLSKEDKIEETDDLQVDAQISPAIGNP